MRFFLEHPLRIIDSLIKTVESLGFCVSTETYNVPTSYIHFGEEKIRFFLNERVRREDHKLTEEEKKELEKYPYHSTPKWDFFPTGKLSLRIDEWGAHGVKKDWSDTATKQVEDILYDFLMAIAKVAEYEKQERLESEERHRRWLEEKRRQEEIERQRQIEEERRQDLEKQAMLWAKSKQLRFYIQEVEESIIGQQLSIEDQKLLQMWSAWAHEHANWLDPLTKGLPFEVHNQGSNT